MESHLNADRSPGAQASCLLERGSVPSAGSAAALSRCVMRRNVPGESKDAPVRQRASFCEICFLASLVRLGAAELPGRRGHADFTRSGRIAFRHCPKANNPLDISFTARSSTPA